LSFAEFLRALRLRALQVVHACGKIINMAHRRKGSNETELSHRWRRRAWQTSRTVS
jgi:hypothetical protein